MGAPSERGRSSWPLRRAPIREEAQMTYVVNESCIKCKLMDCVEVCPVDCFYEGENMLVIHPDECIDCGVCEPECPVDAIKPGLEKWLSINTEFAHLCLGGRRQHGNAQSWSIRRRRGEGRGERTHREGEKRRSISRV